jgi:membrane-bound metal-dependent hydrolase YbcI (DUF457 family)
MANFATHLNITAFISAIGVVSVEYLNISTSNALEFFFAGIVGGVLPDIDHDKSTPVKILQFFFSNLIAFIVTFEYIGKYPILNVLFIWISSYLLVSFMFYLFKKFTTHRGMFHSIPAAFIFWFLTSLLSNYFGLEIKKSYLLGFFVFLGYITHLLLDEIYSVDIMGNKLKKSFGSALKLYSNKKSINLFVYLLLFMMFICLPKKEVFFHFIKGI